MKVNGTAVNQYSKSIKGLFDILIGDIEKERGVRPKVCVLDVNTEKEYKIKFDFEDVSGLEINKLSLGLDNSYFKGMDIDIPQSVKSFQSDLNKVDT